MKKFKLGISFVVLVVFSVATKNFLLLINYFLALSLHEMAHLFVAVKRGYKLKLVKLDMLGLAIDLDEKIEDKDAFAINIAGPFFNLLLCLCCLSCYYLFPKSYFYLNTFCVSNLVIALFNLLPIYPLDGGKICKSFFKNLKHYKIFDWSVRLSLCLFCIIMFACSNKNIQSIYFLLFGVFFVFSVPKFQPTLTVFKFKKKKELDKISFIKIEDNVCLIEMLKHLKSNSYTVFYVKSAKNTLLDEEDLINFATKYALTTPICNIIKN